MVWTLTLQSESEGPTLISCAARLLQVGRTYMAVSSPRRRGAQSSAYQVIHNLESQRLQYAMQDRLHQLGWREVDVVDDDLGRSAAGTVTRAGFERMVAEVCLGNVGGVAAREVSRFARNSREWQHLVEVCRVVDTVLIDLETVYCPRLSNDRLLLGLKRQFE